MTFISKTIRDRTIPGKFCTPRVLSTILPAPLKNLDFSDFWLSSLILAEMENVVYLERRKR